MIKQRKCAVTCWDKKEKTTQVKKKSIQIDSLRATLKKYKIGKLQAMLTYMDSCSKNPLPPEADEPKWMTKIKTILIQKDPLKEPPQITTDP